MKEIFISVMFLYSTLIVSAVVLYCCAKRREDREK
jgi:hypothetical protein